jgi:hypothetical protein
MQVREIQESTSIFVFLTFFSIIRIQTAGGSNSTLCRYKSDLAGARRINRFFSSESDSEKPVHQHAGY